MRTPEIICKWIRTATINSRNAKSANLVLIGHSFSIISFSFSGSIGSNSLLATNANCWAQDLISIIILKIRQWKRCGITTTATQIYRCMCVPFQANSIVVRQSQLQQGQFRHNRPRCLAGGNQTKTRGGYSYPRRDQVSGQPMSCQKSARAVPLQLAVAPLYGGIANRLRIGHHRQAEYHQVGAM